MSRGAELRAGLRTDQDRKVRSRTRSVCTSRWAPRITDDITFIPAETQTGSKRVNVQFYTFRTETWTVVANNMESDRRHIFSGTTQRFEADFRPNLQTTRTNNTKHNSLPCQPENTESRVKSGAPHTETHTHTLLQTVSKMASQLQVCFPTSHRLAASFSSSWNKRLICQLSFTVK